MYASPILLDKNAESLAEIKWIDEVKEYAKGMDLKLTDTMRDVSELSPVGRFLLGTISDRWGKADAMLASTNSIEDVTKILQFLAYGERYGYASAIQTHDITDCKCAKCEFIRENENDNG